MNARYRVENHFLHKDEGGQFGLNCAFSLFCFFGAPHLSYTKWLHFGYTP